MHDSSGPGRPHRGVHHQHLGFAAREVRVLVGGYDPSEHQTGQVIAWGPTAIQPGDRVYFDVTVPAGAAPYDVSIFSWKWK
jgi:hypothetical protein